MHLLHIFVKFKSQILLFTLLISVCTLSVFSFNNNYNLVCRKINSEDGKAYIETKVTSFPQRKKDNVAFIARIENSDKGYLKGEKIYAVLPEYRKEISKGDLLSFECNIQVADRKRNEGEFDYRDYLKGLGVSLVTYNADVSSHEKTDSPFKKIYDIRREFLQNCEQYIYTSGLISAVITGDRLNIDPETEDNLKKAGVYHIVAISGLHLNLFIIAVSEIIAKMKKKRIFKARLSFMLCSFTGIFVMIFTGFGSSVIRAFVMMIILNASHIFPRESNSKISLILTGFIVLTILPHTMWSVSWWLSFLSTFGVIVAVDIIKILSRKYNLPSFLKGYIAQTIIISFMTSLFTLPVTSLVFGYISVHAWIANALILPIMPFFMASGVVFAVFSSFRIDFVSYFLGYVITGASQYIMFIVKVVANLPFNIIKTYYDTFPKVITSILSLIWVINIIKTPRIKKIILFIIILSVATGSVLIYNHIDSEKLKITFAYSGQGDTNLLQVNGYNIMIDSGSIDTSGSDEESINAMLRAKNVRKLDSLIITHFDTDHTNIAINLADNLNIKTLILPAFYDYSDTDCTEIREKLIEKAKENNTKILYVKKGSLIRIGEDAYFEFLSPTEDMHYDSNNMSLVSKFVYGKSKVMFFGDAKEKAYEHLLDYNLECDVIKLAHHGSYSPLTEEIIELTNAKIAVASCGENNIYNHPNQKVIDILKKNNIKTYRTDKDGAVTVIMDKYSNFKVKTVR